MAVVSEPRINAVDRVVARDVAVDLSPRLVSGTEENASPEGTGARGLKSEVREAGFDDSLVIRARGGDRPAQAELVRSLQDLWFRFCVGRLGSVDDAKDAAQETALRFFKGLAGARGGSSVRTWSLGIALNVCREMRRERGDERVDLASVAEPIDEGEPLEAAFDRIQRSARLHEVMEALSSRQREVVLLRFFEGLSVAETAHAMGCAEGTVKATLAQALRALRRRWENKP